MISVNLLTSITQIDEHQWNEIVVPNRLICRHSYLRAVESSQINQCRYYYPIVVEDGQILAHACLYTITTELDSFARGALKRLITLIRRRWPNFMVLHSLECGTPVALGNTFSFRAGADRAKLMEALVNATESLAAKLGIHVLLFRDFQDEDAGWAEPLCTFGYSRIQNLPCARLNLRWKSFDEYLQAMRSEYRSKLLATTKKGQDTGVTLTEESDFAKYAPQLAQLWRQAYDHAQEYRREMLLEDFFRNVHLHLGPKTSIIAARKQEQLIGFLLLFLDDETLTTIFSGLDYSQSRETGVYFNMFYFAVDLAIQRGFKEIDFGITTLAPKLDLGAVAVPLFMYMKHRHPILNRIVPQIFARMTPPAPLQRRNVFKKE
ncbi:MAG TPA: hypothetical protein DCZ95_13570 [Verrucomicrobia bacterium]|nr:MAG: hypothetical protein A2X46_11420 [Lentisphaerae bacterium GWF2_57_35]HBA85113.1 hypothetical protein [Verrucomicrobiota bacterium]